MASVRWKGMHIQCNALTFNIFAVFRISSRLRLRLGLRLGSLVIQGHHWNNSQATLHPFAVYYIKDSHLECLSICVISDLSATRYHHSPCFHCNCYQLLTVHYARSHTWTISVMGQQLDTKILKILSSCVLGIIMKISSLRQNGIFCHQSRQITLLYWSHSRTFGSKSQLAGCD